MVAQVKRRCRRRPGFTLPEEVLTVSIREEETHPGSRDGRYPGRTRRGVGLRFWALAVVAALVLAACSGSGDTSQEGDVNAPTDGTTAVAGVDPQAVEVATGFVSAYGAFDMDRAATYLAEDADISDPPDGALDGPYAAWFKSIGFELIPGTCEVTGSTDSGTSVRCPYEYNSLRSGEVGNGPYSGSFYDLIVKDGAIVRVSDTLEYESNGFSAEMWEPFAEWVKETYPKDVKVMYTDQTQTQQRVDEKSIRLWEQRTLEYANEVAAG